MNTKLTSCVMLLLAIIAIDTTLKAQNTADKDHKEESTPTYYSPGGTYSDWYFSPNDGYASLEWTFVPVADPPASLTKEGLLHYYAYNFALILVYPLSW